MNRPMLLFCALLCLISCHGFTLRYSFRKPSQGPMSRYKAIRPTACRGSAGPAEAAGVCMFSFDCMQAKGTPIGVCMDSIYVGSCCRLAQNSPPASSPVSVKVPPLVVNDGLQTVTQSTTALPLETSKVSTTTTSTTTTSTTTKSTTTRSSTVKTTPPTLVRVSTSSPSPPTASRTSPPPTTSSVHWTSTSELSEATKVETTPASASDSEEFQTIAWEQTKNTEGSTLAHPTLEKQASPSTSKPASVSPNVSASPKPSAGPVIGPAPGPVLGPNKGSKPSPADAPLSGPNAAQETPEAGEGSSTREPSTASTPVAATSPPLTTKAATTTPEPTTPSKPPGLNEICGRRSIAPKGRIVGGAQSTFSEWPWMVSLRQWKKNAFLHKCGAALLNNYWAVTAAHCVENVAPNDLLLRLGEFDVSHENEPYPYIERRVQIIAPHPEFDPRTFEYDLALLRFYEPVHYRKNIVPICTPTSNSSYIGKRATVTGWGRLYEDGPLPDTLQHVDVPVITNKDCETMYRRAGYIEDIPNIFICAGLSRGGKDSCEGDSGGPLVMEREANQWELIGIISWGIGCALPNQPGVYTRISEFTSWIHQIIAF